MVPAGGSVDVRCVSPASYMHIGAATGAPAALQGQAATPQHLQHTAMLYAHHFKCMPSLYSKDQPANAQG